MSKGAKRFLYRFGSLVILVVTVFLVAYFTSVDKEQQDKIVSKIVEDKVPKGVEKMF